MKKEDQEYLEQILSDKFHDQKTKISEMKQIISIAKANGINTESMESTLIEYTNDRLIKTFGYVPMKLSKLHKLTLEL